MRGDRLPRMSKFLGDFEAGGTLGVTIGSLPAAHRGGFAAHLPVAVIGVAVAQAVAGDAARPCDPACK